MYGNLCGKVAPLGIENSHRELRGTDKGENYTGQGGGGAEGEGGSLVGPACSELGLRKMHVAAPRTQVLSASHCL